MFTQIIKAFIYNLFKEKFFLEYYKYFIQPKFFFLLSRFILEIILIYTESYNNIKNEEIVPRHIYKKNPPKNSKKK